MKYARFINLSTGLLGILLLSLPALPQSWTGSLERGGVVSIDPNTNRATVYSNSGAGQLWDGTHRLEDGSVIIVNDGVVTSGGGQAGPGASSSAAPLIHDGAGTRANSVCVSLAIKVCGFNGECNDSPACSPARQLMKLERDEIAQGAGQSTQTSAQCREALSDESFFARCRKKQPAGKPTACQRLVNRVCGSDGQCSDSAACSPAQQLLTMENREREASRHPERPTYTSRKCSEALKGSDFFKHCALETAASAGGDGEKPGSENLPAPPRFRDRSRR